MSKLFIITLCALMTFGATHSLTAVSAQTGAKRGPDASVVRDPEMEKDSLHNLEVARHYFKLKKAYKATIARCEEIMAGYPKFSRIDEVLYLAGASSLRLAENQGKQKTDVPADKLRDDARNYLSRIVNEFPQSSFRESASAELRALGGAKDKQAKEDKPKQ